MSSADVLANIEEHADAILRVCSYHRRDFDLVVVRSRPHDMQLVQGSLQAAFETLPTAGLGILGRLPAELMSMVLRELDILSFFYFRQVNRRARVLSTGLWEYELVSKHGLEGLRGLLRAELAHCFTISDLYRSLITDKCSTCGGFKGSCSFSPRRDVVSIASSLRPTTASSLYLLLSPKLQIYLQVDSSAYRD
jgi:hypothetical protein